MIKIPQWVILVAFAFIATIASFFVNPIYVWGGVAAASIGFILLGKPFWLLMIILGWSLTAFIWESILRTKLLARVDDVLILVMLAVFIGHVVIKRIKPVPYLKVYLATIFLTFISKMYNGSSLVNMGLFILAYCAPYLVFLLMYIVHDKFLTRKIINLIIGIFLFGVLLNIGWLVRVNPIPNIHYGTIDFAKGTLGSCDNFSYFTIFMIFLSLSFIRLEFKRRRRTKYLILLVISLLQLYLTYTNHAYLYLIILFVVYLIVTRQKISGYITLLSFAFFVILLLSTVGQSRMASEMDGYQGFRLSDPVEVRKRVDRFINESHKVDLFMRVVPHGYHEGTFSWLIGHGPGAGVGTVARNKPSDYTFKMLGEYYLSYSGRLGLVGSSITQNPWSGISSLWSEVGMVGTVLFFTLPLLPARTVLKRLLRGYYDQDGYQKCVAEAFVMFVAIFFTINLMKDFWSVDAFAFPMWALAALALKKPNNRIEGGDVKSQ